jgi:hypothetical protein
MTTLAWINTQTNICDNTTLDDRPASEIQIDGYLILDLEAIGGGGVGDIWDGQKLSKPPALEQPPTSGTQEI